MEVSTETMVEANQTTWPDNATQSFWPDLNTSDPEAIRERLQSMLGARYRSQVESIILTIVYSIIFITGIVGNVFTCVVITRNNYMHTATNYYLFSLAISDVLTLILGELSIS